MLILHNSIKAIVILFLSKGVTAKFKPFITVKDFKKYFLTHRAHFDFFGFLRYC